MRLDMIFEQFISDTIAYEQQNRKLSVFVDFVKHYFPYIEKLIPTIKFLRETLNFGDAVIRKLCTFKDVSIKGNSLPVSLTNTSRLTVRFVLSNRIWKVILNST